MRNGDTCIEPEELESNNSQKKYHINYLLEERIKLLKSQIISGCAKNSEGSRKYKSRRRQLCYNPGTFKQYLPVHYSKNDLPTIIEISPEKPYTKGIIQSVDVINKSKIITFNILLYKLLLIDSGLLYFTLYFQHSRLLLQTLNWT